MKISEIKSGEIFCIGGTKSYPKLKLDVGYVDMRDEIRKDDESTMNNFDCRLMTNEEVETEFKKYGMSMDDVKEIKEYYLIRR